MQTRDQRYGAAIFAQVSEIHQRWPKKPKHEGKRKEYGSMAHKLPVLIRTAGLAQALAFVEARHQPGSPPRELLKHLCAVLEEPELAKKSRETTDLSEYVRLTHNALAALLWYKRFAQSVLDVDASAASDVGQVGDDATVDNGGVEGDGE